MTQARGGASQILLDFETTYGENPAVAAAISMPYHFPVDLKASRPLKPSTVHRPNRNPAMPFYGNRDLRGGMSVPVDRIGIGYWLKCLMGAPATTWAAADTIDNAAAVDKGGGLVGIPITGHAFAAGEPITIAGTVHYNGDYEIVSETENEIVITDTYAAETFAGTETCQTNLRSHVFKPSSSLPSFLIDVGFTDVAQYFLFNGFKMAKFAMAFGGDNELMAKLDFMGASETASGSAYDGSPTTFSLSKFSNRQLSFLEGGGALATIKNGSLEIGNELDGDSFPAAGDTRFDLPHGDLTANGKFSLFFQDRTLYDIAVAGTERSFQVLFTDGVYSLAFLFPEIHYTVETPTIVKGGVYADFAFEAFYENSSEAAAIQATLVNTEPEASYA